MSNSLHICIVGGGIIGASNAFHLSEAGCTNITIVERTNIACGASGRAGGFLARNWRLGAEGQFSEVSFQAHSELAARLQNEFAIDVMYRRLTTFNVSVSENKNPKKTMKQATDAKHLPKWFTADAHEHENLGNEETTAQVHPG